MPLHIEEKECFGRRERVITHAFCSSVHVFIVQEEGCFFLIWQKLVCFVFVLERNEKDEEYNKL